VTAKVRDGVSGELVEAFTTMRRKCGTCRATQHVYFYPYLDKARTVRDYSRCLACRT
jgi:hypothetical protein